MIKKINKIFRDRCEVIRIQLLRKNSATKIQNFVKKRTLRQGITLEQKIVNRMRNRLMVADNFVRDGNEQIAKQRFVEFSITWAARLDLKQRLK